MPKQNEKTKMVKNTKLTAAKESVMHTAAINKG